VSVSCCMDRVLEVSRLPRNAWAAAIADIPDACERPECGAPKSCRQRAADYLRMQWRIAERRAASKGKP